MFFVSLNHRKKKRVTGGKYMKQKNISTFLGEQCRKYRKILGITQEELAEKMNTTPQTISNYERMGIKDVDVEKEISSILGVDLREDTEDNEGEPGELGKEILYYLIEHKGNCLVSDLLTQNVLFGITSERLNHEIEKIAKLDLCCRDIDKMGWKPAERLFITAKGIVAAKNNVSSIGQSEKINNKINEVISYEMLLASKTKGDEIKQLSVAKDLEDFGDLRPWLPIIDKLIQEIDRNYKADYLSYLRNNWLNVLPYNKIKCSYDQESIVDIEDDEWLLLFPGKNFYSDLIYRMAYGYTNDWRNEYIFGEEMGHAISSYEEEISRYQSNKYSANKEGETIIVERLEWFYERYYELLNNDLENNEYPHQEYMEKIDLLDKFIWDTRVDLFNRIPAVKDAAIKFTLKEKYKTEDSDENIEEFRDSLSAVGREKFDPFKRKRKEFLQNTDELEKIVKKNIPELDEYVMDPEKWFTKEQIAAFIKENYHKPATYEELLIQEKLLEIEKLIPEAKEEYYQFPKSWEKNGLADLVREVCCLNMSL